MTGTKIQKTAPGTAGSGTGSHPSTVPNAVSHPGKGVKALKHESHKIGYRKDHPHAGAGIKTPSVPLRK